MFGSQILETVIGVVFIYFLFCIICTAVREGIEAWLKTRAAYLEQGIRELLYDKEGNSLAKNLYEHPLIYGLFSKEYTTTKYKLWGFRGGNLPSYIPSKNFALALMDLAARGPVSNGNTENITVESIRRNIANIPEPNVRRVLLTAIDTAQGDINKAQENIEKWFDSTMERVSGWYKRSTQLIIFLIGFTLAVAMNVDTIAVANYLYKNEAVRAVIVAQAEKATNTEKTTEGSNLSGISYEDAKKQLKGMNIPIGWHSEEEGKTEEGKSVTKASFLSKVYDNLETHFFGWLLTAVASTLGAPFWFDILSKLMVVRSTVKPLGKTTSANSSPGNVNTPSPSNLIGDDNEIDGCNLQVSKETPDEELPQAEGGVV